MFRLVFALVLRLIIVAFLVDAGLRAVRHGGAGFLVLGAFLEALALVTLAIAAIAGAALVERFRRPAL